ncbi:hypothetical protein Osc7112_1215 [Oscillatoria nigro-viridis PCC 7112]|uniref:Uncharacterized protein n=1 Tax=Phormidium nigroviride PCC 7112 TaxID=179408 RepID=K9VES0_9CYAN|nr:hypothetical protein Osc7112_1215 [Oscillatoria nigro-viridis PCC 7112]
MSYELLVMSYELLVISYYSVREGGLCLCSPEFNSVVIL